jgi:corrinoid protein of di/trimethylamine methyltransferase
LVDYTASILDAVLSYDEDSVKRLVREAIENGVDPIQLLNEGLSKAIVQVGDKFGEEKIFLVELMLAAKACAAGADIVRKKILESKLQVGEPKGVIVIGTVEGDIHNIGKDIVVALLEASGFQVHDIGVDQPAVNFVSKAMETKAKIVASSALLTTSRRQQKVIEENLKAAGIRSNIKTIIGGAATDANWANEVGADYYAATATEGVGIIRRQFGGG